MHYVVLFLVFIFTLPAGIACGQLDGGLGGIDLGDFGGGLGDGGLGGIGGDGGGDDGIQSNQQGIGGDLEDTRNQGFVGATSVQIQELGFIGASSETSGPALSNGATFGGGINNSGNQPAAGGGGGGVNGGFGGGGGGQGQLGAGTENGFQVIRQSMRTRLVPQINVAPIPGPQVVSRFQNRIARQPVPQISGPPFANQAFFNGAAPRVNVQVQDRTAFLTGFVGSQAERDRWERQLRLEPGVYRIVNQIEVAAPSR